MPQNWKTYKLGAVMGLKKNSIRPEQFNGQPYLGLEHISQGTFLLDGVGSSTDVTSNKYRFEPEDILYGKIRPYFKKAYKPGFSGICSTDILVIKTRNSEVVDQNYLYELVKTQWFTDKAVETSTGTKMPRADWNSLKTVECEFPPLLEQKAIASILSALDDKIELNLQMNKTLEEMAMALYKHWFVENKENLSTQLSDYIYLNPRLSLKKGTKATYVDMKALSTKGMSVSQVTRRIVKGGAKFQKGDTLLARITPCLQNGKIAFVDFLKENEIGFGSTEFLVLRAKEAVSKHWVYCLSRDKSLINHAISCMIGTSGRQRIQNEPFLKYELPLIDLNLMSRFDQQVEPWFHQIRQNTIENQTLTQLRDTLLPKLISGEVRVKEAEQTIAQAL